MLPDLGASHRTPQPDDAITLASIGILAFIVADLTHEGLGHGLATLAVGAKPVLLTTCYFSSAGVYPKWIPAGGGIANVVVGLLSLLFLRIAKPAKPHVRYFFMLAVAFNLFFAAGYPAYSGLANFGDWAAVIAGLTPLWLWRTLLVVVSVSLYCLALCLLAVEIRPFGGSNTPLALSRLRRVTLIPFLAALFAAALGGALNPRGWTMLFTAALPAAASAAGLTQLDHFPAAVAPSTSGQAPTITRSFAWIIAAALVLLFFVAFVGPGIQFHASQ